MRALVVNACSLYGTVTVSLKWEELGVLKIIYIRHAYIQAHMLMSICAHIPYHGPLPLRSPSSGKRGKAILRFRTDFHMHINCSFSTAF